MGFLPVYKWPMWGIDILKKKVFFSLIFYTMIFYLFLNVNNLGLKNNTVQTSLEEFHWTN